ncbi:MAG: GIY-YIG nuclease family protein [Salinivirgaceae bacterium]|jgi:hypothetical protein|nr:GIY-YIG nuclease family protein [Salinivirgaceae bacterium]
MDKDKVLNDIFENDPLGLLNVKARQSAAKTADERLLANFQEINDFVDNNGKEPEPNMANVSESQLYFRLKGLRDDPEKANLLKSEDRHGLLSSIVSNVANEPRGTYKKAPPKIIESIDDILNTDGLDILDDDSEGLFDFKHTPKETSMPDYIAKRKPCKDFEKFEQHFIDCQADLSSGKRKLTKFKNEQQIDKGYFFVLNGILLYISEIGDKEFDEQRRGNARLRCIFENGTESDMLLRSLSASLYKDGRRVTEHEDKLLDNFNNITEEDEEAGYIYVLKSKSTDEKIASIPDLYKIGFSRTEVTERIKNAEKEPTYLMSPVHYIAGWKCYNMNPRTFEQLIHNFFGTSCLEADVFDEKGKRHTPREWFIAPFDVIEQAVALIISGEVVKYRYDVENGVIVER